MGAGPVRPGDVRMNIDGCEDDCMRDIQRILKQHQETILRQEFYMKEHETQMVKLSTQIAQNLDYAKASHEEMKARFQQVDDEINNVKQTLNRDFLSDITETKVLVRRHDAVLPTFATREFVESRVKGHEGDEVQRYGRRKEDKYKTVVMLTSVITATVAAGSLLAMLFLRLV
jgi:hypothetical protein